MSVFQEIDQMKRLWMMNTILKLPGEKKQHTKAKKWISEKKNKTKQNVTEMLSEQENDKPMKLNVPTTTKLLRSLDFVP